MAIRFDKGSRQTTNGPVFFFADPAASVDLDEEIRSAIEGRLSFYAYRLPGDHMISFGTSEGIVEGIGIPGFVIAPFIPGSTYITIPYRPIGKAKTFTNESYKFPDHSTTLEEHEKEINTIKQFLASIGNGKVIASRVNIEPGEINIGATFTELCIRHKDAFIFCFSTPQTGCWLGASPELLLKSVYGGVASVALAGTRAADSDGIWDIKNIEEQDMVRRYISKIFLDNLLMPDIGDTLTVKAGKVEHLCTPITGFTEEPLTTLTLTKLLNALSPTPALCGEPRDKALEIIKQTECFDRAYYGGFCGPYRTTSDFSFYVNLRCCLIEAKRYCIFTGGGITLKSVIEEEWNELNSKASTIKDSIHLESTLRNKFSD